MTAKNRVGSNPQTEATASTSVAVTWLADPKPTGRLSLSKWKASRMSCRSSRKGSGLVSNGVGSTPVVS